MRQQPRSRLSRRAVEVMVAIIVASIFCLLAGPYLYRLYRRERLRVAAQEISTVLIAARMKAVKQSQQVVVWIDPATRLALAWTDDPPYNFIQDPGEATVLRFRVRSGVYFRYAPSGDAVNGAGSVAFDGYQGNPELVDRVVFRPDGTLIAPQDPNSKAPRRPSAVTAAVPHGSIDCNPDDACRGVYISDKPDGGAQADRNTFRISVNDFGPIGRVTILKWLPASEGANPGETNYVPPPWKWVD
jgi:Tfp pilus assembly protein FimT